MGRSVVITGDTGCDANPSHLCVYMGAALPAWVKWTAHAPGRAAPAMRPSIWFVPLVIGLVSIPSGVGRALWAPAAARSTVVCGSKDTTSRPYPSTD